MKTTLLAMLAVLVMSVAAADEPAAVLPPTFLPAVALYTPDGSFAKLIVGAARFLSCREALDDTVSAIAKAAEFAPAGSRTIGICIPLHTYNADDIAETVLPPQVITTPVPFI